MSGEDDMEGEAEDFVIDENGDLCPVVEWDEEDEEECCEQDSGSILLITDEMIMQLFRVPQEDVSAFQIALKTLMTMPLTSH
jgi:hypothetical protein